MSPVTNNIPGHVTGLYIFTVLNLALLLNLSATDATILVLNSQNETIGEITRDLEAKFGPRVPEDGVWGHLSYTVPHNACDTVKPPPASSHSWIALIKRRDCDFDVKVFNAQQAGYVAAIVFNDDSDDLVPMGAGKEGELVVIPSAFIGFSDAEYLYRNFDQSTQYSIFIDDHVPFNVQLYLVPFAIVVGICFILMLVFMIVKWVRDIRKRRRSRLSKDALKKIPVKKFKKGDDYDICAICLDEYEEGDKLRILPCSHAYHQKCIDPWLTKNKKTCPICKRKVIPGGEGDSSSSSDSDEESAGENENTPLLPAQDLRRNPLLSRGTGGTFDNSGLPEAVRNHLTAIPDTSASDSDDSEAAPSSFYQSSVEVHSDTATVSRTGSAGKVLTGAPVSTYAVMDETDESTSAPAPAQDASQLFDGQEVLEDEESSSLFGVDGGERNEGLDLSEDHFDPDAMDPLGVQLNTQDDEEAGASKEADNNDNDGEGEGQKEEEEVEVVPARRNKKKKYHSRKRRDENA